MPVDEIDWSRQPLGMVSNAEIARRLMVKPSVVAAARKAAGLPVATDAHKRWKVEDYIEEEVHRQGHNTQIWKDGGVRVEWMLKAWSEAQCWEGNSEVITLERIARLGRLVEPLRNSRGFRSCGVRVGLRICPSHLDVERLLTQLLAAVDRLPPIEWYKEFEMIHPFVDGNGRTGKILLNWISGYLDQPFFPPANLFGEPIRNS